MSYNFNDFPCTKTIFLRFVLLLPALVVVVTRSLSCSDFPNFNFNSLYLFFPSASPSPCDVCVCMCISDVFYSLQEETFDMIYEWRKMLEEWTSDHPSSEAKILMTEAYTNIPTTMRFYESNSGRLGAHLPFNFQLIYVPKNASAQHVKENIDTWLNNMPQGHTPSWVVSNTTTSRFGRQDDLFPSLPSLSIVMRCDSNDPVKMTTDNGHHQQQQQQRKERESRLNRPSKDKMSCCVLYDSTLFSPERFVPRVFLLFTFVSVFFSSFSSHVVVPDWVS